MMSSSEMDDWLPAIVNLICVIEAIRVCNVIDTGSAQGAELYLQHTCKAQLNREI